MLSTLFCIMDQYLEVLIWKSFKEFTIQEAHIQQTSDKDFDYFFVFCSTIFKTYLSEKHFKQVDVYMQTA